MDKFIGGHNQPKFTQDEIDNLNRLIFSKEIASITNNLPKLKALGPDVYTDEFYWIFTEDIKFIVISPRN